MDPTLKHRTLEKLREQLDQLAPGLQRVGKYMLDKPADFGLDAIRDTAAKCGVSTYTLVRMAQQLGFASFQALREPFRQALVSNVESVERPEWLEPLRDRGALGAVQADAALNSLAIVQRSLQRLSSPETAALVEAMHGARRLYVSGVRASCSLAGYFYYVGRMAVPQMQLIPGPMNSAIDEMLSAGPGDLLFALTFTPCSRETVEACAFARRRGLTLALMSDSEVVPGVGKPDFSLVAAVQSTHRFGCYTGAMAMIESLLALLIARGGAAARERVAAYEALRADYRAYRTAENN